MASVSGHLLLHHVWPFSSQCHSPVHKWDMVSEELSELRKIKEEGEEESREEKA